MREKVVRQVARAMQPVLTDVKVDWGQLKAPATPAPSASNFLQCPSIAPPIFMSSRYILHALNVSLPDFAWQQAKAGQKVEIDCEITITVQSNHRHEKDVMHHSVELTGEQITQACVIHTLAAKERIRELENQVRASSGDEKRRLEDEILRLALKHTLSSSRTSFVAVYNVGMDNERFEDLPSFHNTEQEQKIVFGMRGASYLCSLPTSVSSAPPRGVPPAFFGACLLQDECASAESECASFGTLQPKSAFGTLRATSASAGPRAVAMGRLPESRDSLLPQSPWKDAKATAFENLIQLQSAKGLWQITPMLNDIVHAIIPASLWTVTMQSLQEMSKEKGVDEAVVGVMMALQLLETYYKHRHAEWEMLATKALVFLNEDAKISAKLQEDIKESIVKLLGK